MTEALTVPYIESRQRQLGALGYDLSYQHLNLKPGQRQPFSAQGQLWLVVAADANIRITSDTGQYLPKSNTLQFNQHEHTGQLVVQNLGRVRQQVRFVVATWRYSTPPAPPKVP